MHEDKIKIKFKQYHEIKIPSNTIKAKSLYIENYLIRKLNRTNYTATERT